MARSLIALLFVAIFVVAQLVESLPYDGSATGNFETPLPNPKEPVKAKSRYSLCGDKGRFCEIICKNNPSEGGKLCNCDTLVLRSNPVEPMADCTGYNSLGSRE